MTEKLKILQYNVRKQGDCIMAPLLADPRVSQFPVLAIQEPFHNSHTNSTHNPSYTSFHFILALKTRVFVSWSISLSTQVLGLGIFRALTMAICASEARWMELEIL